jgi:hypothetical protein
MFLVLCKYNKFPISYSSGRQAFYTLNQEEVLNWGCVKIKQKITTMIIKTVIHSKFKPNVFPQSTLHLYFYIRFMDKNKETWKIN